MWKFLLSIAVAALLVSCGQSSISDTDEVSEFDGEDLMRPGVGKLSVFDKILDECVEYDSIEHGTNADGVENIYHLQLIKSHQHLMQALDVSVAAQVSALGPLDNHLSGKMQFTSQHSVDQFSTYLLVTSIVKRPSAYLKNPRLKAEVADLVEADYEQFRRRCGDSFMAGYTTGGEYYGLIEIHSSSEKEKTDVLAQIEGAGIYGVAKISADAKMTKATEVLSKLKTVSLWHVQKGGVAENVTAPKTVDEMIEHGRKFPEFVQEDSKSWNVSATFKDYFTIANGIPKEKAAVLEEIQEVVQTLGDLCNKLIEAIGSVDYALSNPSEFAYADFNQLQLEKTSLEDTMQLLRQTVRACYRDYVDRNIACKIPDSLTQLNPKKPIRRILLSRCSEEREWKQGDVCMKTKDVCLQLSEKTTTNERWTRIDCQNL